MLVLFELFILLFPQSDVYNTDDATVLLATSSRDLCYKYQYIYIYIHYIFIPVYSIPHTYLLKVNFYRYVCGLSVNYDIIVLH